MHQGLDPKALPWGHSKGIHPPLVYLTATLCVKVSPHEWRLTRAQHSFPENNPITVMLLNFGNMTLRQDIYELLNIKISNERQRERNAVLE